MSTRVIVSMPAAGAILLGLLVTLPAWAANNVPTETSVCEVARHPSQWDGKLVRIHAGIDTVCIEGGYGLFDIRCPERGLPFDIAMDPNDPTRRTSDLALQKIDGARCTVAASPNRNRHAEATILGRLAHNEESNDIDLTLIDALDVEIVPGPDPTRWSPARKKRQ